MTCLFVSRTQPPNLIQRAIQANGELKFLCSSVRRKQIQIYIGITGKEICCTSVFRIYNNLTGTNLFCEFVITLLGWPKKGLLAHRWLMTSRIKCFWPLQVVRMLMRSAGYPNSLMYMYRATEYSASARFYAENTHQTLEHCNKPHEKLAEV